MFNVREKVNFGSHKNGKYSDQLRVCQLFMKKSEKIKLVDLTFIGPCIANILAEYNQQDATFLNLFIYVRRSTCFRRFFRPSSGALNCTYSVRYLSEQYCYLLLA